MAYNFRCKSERNGIESQVKCFDCSYVLVHLCCYNKNNNHKLVT